MWSCVLLCSDDVLAISNRGEEIIRNEIGQYFNFKEDSIGPPDIYLGGKLSKVVLENGVQAWGFSSSKYVKNQNLTCRCRILVEITPNESSRSPLSNEVLRVVVTLIFVERLEKQFVDC